MTSHIVLLSCQPTSTADLAHQGWIGLTDWLVTQKANMEIRNFLLFSIDIHSVPACKQQPYKERLVKILPAKEQRLVERK